MTGRRRALAAAVVAAVVGAGCGGADAAQQTPSANVTSPVQAPRGVLRTDPTSTPTGPGATGGPATATTGTTSSARPFDGLFEFAGDNSSADATDPDLAGVDLVYYWSQIEPVKGQFDWGLIDRDMAPWIAAGKKVILRISTSGEAGWDPPYSGQGTPDWVVADGTKIIHDNGEILPVYWDRPYLVDYRAFVTGLGAHFNGNGHVALVEAGIGMGGETLPETNASRTGIAAWEAEGYSDQVWLATIRTLTSYFEAAFTRTPVYSMVDRTFFDGSGVYFNRVMAWFRSLPRWGLQDDGLSSTQTLSSAWAGRPLALEQLNPTRVSHDCLCGDISNGLDTLHGSYLLLYRSDIDQPANAAYLKAAAARASGG